ncbi:MAG TPA: hypothetical protein VF407_18225, partial [Polyangiaceae bacterium]
MSLSREEMMQVMSYADGELEGAALARAEALVGANDEAAQLVRELRTLGDCVRVVEEERKLERAPIDVAGDVMSAIEKSKVVPIGSFAERRRNAFVAGAITAVIAAAAGWFLVVRGNEALPGGSGAVAAQASATPVVTAPV